MAWNIDKALIAARTAPHENVNHLPPGGAFDADGRNMAADIAKPKANKKVSDQRGNGGSTNSMIRVAASLAVLNSSVQGSWPMA
jgi:hypothetical protein